MPANYPAQGRGLVRAPLAGIGVYCALLRWRGWRWRTGGVLAVGVAAGVLVLAPVAWSYWISHRELGFERQIEEAARHSADLASLVKPSRWGGRSHSALLERPA